MLKTKNTYLVLSVITSMLLTACGNNGSSGTPTVNAETQATVQTQKGKLIGANDEVTYLCGTKVSQIDENENFECDSMPVTFSIEGVEIGTVKEMPSNKQIYMSDLLGVTNNDTNNITEVITDTQAVQLTIDSIVLEESEPLTQSLDLITEGEYNSTIVWESSNQDILTNEGELTQPTALEGEAKVSLVALVSRGEVREKVIFEFSVGVDEGGVL